MYDCLGFNINDIRSDQIGSPIDDIGSDRIRSDIDDIRSDQFGFVPSGGRGDRTPIMSIGSAASMDCDCVRAPAAGLRDGIGGRLRPRGASIHAAPSRVARSLRPRREIPCAGRYLSARGIVVRASPFFALWRQRTRQIPRRPIPTHNLLPLCGVLIPVCRPVRAAEIEIDRPRRGVQCAICRPAATAMRYATFGQSDPNRPSRTRAEGFDLVLALRSLSRSLSLHTPYL